MGAYVNRFIVTVRSFVLLATYVISDWLHNNTAIIMSYIAILSKTGHLLRRC